VPDEDFVRDWRRGSGEAGDFMKALGEAVERANADLSPHERIKRHILVEKPFTIDNELMTPTLKVRRHKVLEIYGAALEALY
jgi:long-chain acyl-CoA synthetase